MLQCNKNCMTLRVGGGGKNGNVTMTLDSMLYILRTAPCFTSPCLAVYDAELRSTLTEVLNIDFSCESAWSQATLPVCFGGIGVRGASQLAPSAFLASAAGSYNLINQILPARFSAIPYLAVDAAVIQWREGHNNISTSCLPFIFQTKGMGPPLRGRDICSAPTRCI